VNKTFSIAGREISAAAAPFVIAELSGNHAQNLDTAKAMIIAAAAAGADAIKLQTYTADTITLNSTNPEFQINEASSLWQGENLHSLYQKAHTPWQWHAELFQLAKDQGLIAFSSPFDETSVDFLESLQVPCYKIASFEINHFPLLKKVAATGKPVIMSTGMSSSEEIEEAVAHLRENGCTDIALLKCTSAYPASVADANLATIADMKIRFGLPIGLSDHSLGIGVAIVAAAMGAEIIERHFVLDRDSNAVDAAFSSTPAELAQLVKEASQIKSAIGSVHYGPSQGEQDSLKYRRSIYVCRDMEKGQLITKEDIKVVRPALGMHPKFYDHVLGKPLQHAKKINTPLCHDDISEC
jgi:N-acetylneuraminate synthase (EC 2.5.1.56)